VATFPVLNILIETSLRLIGDKGSGGAKSHATDAFHLAGVGKAALLNMTVELGFHLVTALRETSSGGADMDAVFVLRLLLTFPLRDFTKFVECHGCIHLPMRSVIC
jgi:hypothetical protein